MLQTAPANKDFTVTPSPNDGIADLSFSGVADYLAAACWDNQTRIWEVQSNGSTVAKAAIQHEAPALSCAWSKDGTKAFSGGVDKYVRMMDLATGQLQPWIAHDNAVKCMKWVDHANLLSTASWDKTLKYWDLRSPQPALTVQLPERCYSMDVSNTLLVAATAERHVVLFDLNNPSQPYRTIVSPLKWQTRCVACFTNGTGFAIGSIEGRVGIQYADEKQSTSNFSFKCHRAATDNIIYPVNAISFHPVFGTFSTAGGDGAYHFWDKDSKQRLKTQDRLGSPISSTAFNRNGTIFAYSLSYDWSKGHEHSKPNATNNIMLHAVVEYDVKPRNSTAAKKR